MYILHTAGGQLCQVAIATEYAVLLAWPAGQFAHAQFVLIVVVVAVAAAVVVDLAFESG